jgi:serine/threonine protein kinase
METDQKIVSLQVRRNSSLDWNQISQIESLVQGPIRWMAPESIRSHKYSTKSDVFSFGILVRYDAATPKCHDPEFYFSFPVAGVGNHYQWHAAPC